MIGIRIETDAKTALKKLRIIGKELNTTEAAKVIGMSLIEWIDNNFRSQGSLGGKKWKELSKNTVAGRRKGSSRILQDTGRLKQSFTKAPFPKITKGPGILTVEVGTNIQYAKYHEYGTKPYTIRPRTKKALAFTVAGGKIVRKFVNHPGLPARPMLPSKQKAERVSIKTLKAYVNRVVELAKVKGKTT